MIRDFTAAEAVITAGLDRVFPAAQIEVRQRGEVLWSAAYGWLDPEIRSLPTQLDTLFDLASVTKLFVVTAFMTLVEEGVVDLDQPVATVLPEFSGQRPIRPYDDPLRPGATVAVSWEGAQPTTVDAGRVTFRHLLTHTSGLPAWRPLYREGSPDAARRVALTTYFSYPTGARIIYSDIGLILIGMAIESLTGQPLDEAVYRRVTEPLGLGSDALSDESANQQISESANPKSTICNPQSPPSPLPSSAPGVTAASSARCTMRTRPGWGASPGTRGYFRQRMNWQSSGSRSWKTGNQQIGKKANQRINESANRTHHVSRITFHVSRLFSPPPSPR